MRLSSSLLEELYSRFNILFSNSLRPIETPQGMNLWNDFLNSYIHFQKLYLLIISDIDF